MGRKKEQSLNNTEREVRRFLENRFPTAQIDYEPETFTSRAENGNVPKGSTPDFRIKLPTGKIQILFVEATTAGYNGHGDPKARQKKIMKECAPNVPYVVLYREQLEKLQKIPKYRHLKLNFALDEFPKTT